jgi:hypothetical protein
MIKKLIGTIALASLCQTAFAQSSIDWLRVEDATAKIGGIAHIGYRFYGYMHNSTSREYKFTVSATINGENVFNKSYDILGGENRPFDQSYWLKKSCDTPGTSEIKTIVTIQGDEGTNVKKEYISYMNCIK